MKTFYMILVFACAWTQSIAQNVLTEDFNFGPVDSLENSNQWYRSGLNYKNNIKVISPGLEYDGFIGSKRGNCSQLANDGNGDVVYKNFSTPITNGAAYMAFMIRVDSLPPTVTDGYCIAYNPNTGGTNLNTALHILRTSPSRYQMGVRKSSAVAYDRQSYETGKTYLVVLKYSILPGLTDDISSLYVFTQGVPQQEPFVASAFSNQGDDYTGQGSVHLVNNYAQTGLQGCDIKIDGIRVGTSWETSVLAVLSSVNAEASGQAILNRNDPNPFLQKTRIIYQIPETGMVRVHIQNATGQICAELLHDIREAGEHVLEWDASNFAPGIYNCMIQFKGSVVGSKLLRIQ